MSGLTAYRRVLANSRLARLMFGEFVSSIGDWLYLVALLIVVYEVSRDPVALGLVGAARIVPFLVLAVPAGVAADRFDRRRILLATDIARGVLQVVLAGLVFVSAPTLAIVAVAIAAACASAFFGPAIGAYLPSLVTDEADLGPANSLWATLDNLAFFVGPAVAGIVVAAGGLMIAFLLNALSFAIVAVVLFTLPSRPAEPAMANAGAGDADATQIASGLVTGWRSIASRIPGLVALDGATSFLGAGLGVLTVVIAFESLAAGEEMTGYLNAATGIGGIIAGFGAGWLVLRRLDVPIVGASLVGAAATIVLGVTAEAVVALVAIGVVSGALLLLDVINATVLQRAIPDAERGRAMGMLQVSSSIAMIAGAFLAPLIADGFGVAPALLVGAIVATVAALAAVAVMRPSGALAPVALPASDRRLEVLRASIFGGLPPARLEAAIEALETVDVRAGQRVIEQGDVPDRFYFVDRGRFRVSQADAMGGQADIATMGDGDVFGEIGLLRSIPRTASVTAEIDGRLYALDRDAFLGLVGAGPGLGTRLLDLHRGAVPAAAG
jgi:MFS family permease